MNSSHTGRYTGSLYIILQFVIIVIISSKSEQVCFDSLMFIKARGYLENNLYTVTSANSMFDCAATCQSHTDCFSFGFEPKTRSCHLHVENSTTADQDLVMKMEWFHGDISLWPQSLLGPCADHNCNAGERCHVHRGTKQPTCVKVDVALPAGYCPAPVSIPHANISRGDQRVGTLRTYTCSQGYLDVTRDDVNLETSCLSDGSWSAVSLNCSEATFRCRLWHQTIVPANRKEVINPQASPVAISIDIKNASETCFITGPYVRVEPPLETEYVFQAIPSDTLQDLTGNTSSLIFLTKTCSDSNFALHRQPTFDAKLGDVYEVVIGGYGNTLSVINNCIQCDRKAEHSEANILSCTEFRPFWFSWKNGIISVGKGRMVGDRTFMSWPPSSPFTINYVSVSSYINNKGVWLFLPQI